MFLTNEKETQVDIRLVDDNCHSYHHSFSLSEETD